MRELEHLRENTVKKTLPLSMILLALAACAQSPSAIAPVSMGGAYDKISCTQAKTMLAAEQPKLAELTAKQKDAVVGDAIGVFLVLVPVSTLTGSNVAGDLGASKGKVEALQTRLLSCK
jgi:hypothetical protein